MNIRITENTTDNTFRFDILKGKKLILSSRGYPNKSVCLSNLEKTLYILCTNNMLTVSSVTEGFVFHCNNLDSVKFKSLEEASDAIAFLKEAGIEKNGKFEVHHEAKKKEIISKKKIGTANEGYDFKQISKTKKPGIELLDKENLGRYYFHLNDEKGTPLLFSRVYDGKRQRLKAARNLIALVKEKKASIKIISLRNKFIFTIKDLEGYEVTRSKTFPTKESAKLGIKQLEKETEENTAILKAPKKKKKKKKKKKQTKLPKQSFLLKQNAPNGIIGFEAFRNRENKCHYYHYHDVRGRTLLYSKAYSSRRERDEAMLSIIGLSQNKEQYEMKEKAGKHYFVVNSEKGKPIAKSRDFNTKRDMIIGMKHFLNNAPSYKDQKNTLVYNVKETIPLAISLGASPRAAKKSSKPAPISSPVNKPRPSSPPQVETKSSTSTPKKREPKIPQKQTNSPSQRAKKATTNPNKAVPKARITPERNNRSNGPKVQDSRNPSTRKNTLKEVTPPPRSTTKVVQKKATAPRSISQTQKKLEQGTNSFNWWLLPIFLIIAGLAYFLWKSCGATSVSNTAAAVEEVVPPKNVKPVKETPLKKLPTLLGPDGKELGFTKGSLASRIADFLSLPESVLPKTFVLDQVHFATNEDVLETLPNAQLNRIGQILTSYPTTKIQINGHTDNVGSSERNLQLSAARAERVKQYLVEQNIDPSRIATKGLGATQPISTNQTEEGRHENRRSEIVLVRR